MTIGAMQMPEDFKYLNVFLKGKPRHLAYDSFARRHPSMDRVRRAKIFSPFDALKGFSDAVASKDVPYIRRPGLTEEEKAEINRRLTILQGLTQSSRQVREYPIRVTVSFFAPCIDPNSAAYGHRGQRQEVTGICRRVDAAAARSVIIGQTAVRFDDILSIETAGLFDWPWEMADP